jgi:hypothetical protein
VPLWSTRYSGALARQNKCSYVGSTGNTKPRPDTTLAVQSTHSVNRYSPTLLSQTERKRERVRDRKIEKRNVLRIIASSDQLPRLHNLQRKYLFDADGNSSGPERHTEHLFPNGKVSSDHNITRNCTNWVVGKNDRIDRMIPTPCFPFALSPSPFLSRWHRFWVCLTRSQLQRTGASTA